MHGYQENEPMVQAERAEHEIRESPPSLLVDASVKVDFAMGSTLLNATAGRQTIEVPKIRVRRPLGMVDQIKRNWCEDDDLPA
jgi:hypothetical protein